MTKICLIDGKTNPHSFKLINHVMTNLIINICLALASNEIIPDGWKVMHNYNEKKKIRKKL